MPEMPDARRLNAPRFPEMPSVAGVETATSADGSYAGERPNVLLVALPPGTTVAGALTRSKTRSAPVDWCEQALVGGVARALVANAGNANAFTGSAGVETVQRTAAAAGDAVGAKPGQVFVASTGVIGEPLSPGRVESAVVRAARKLGAPRWREAASAIGTTDTYPKGAVRSAEIAGAPATLCGIAKGSGMIAPDLGTMFAFVFTDAAIPASVLQRVVDHAVRTSFNAITVDSDTSTSDTVLVFATGRGPRHPVVTTPADPLFRGFRRALRDLMEDLARQIVLDGEGATKFVTVRVTGARSGPAARRIGLSIANSPLVKTAISGEDPNWGRVVAAIGKSGEQADRDRVAISFGPHRIAEEGRVVPGYDEAPVAAYMKGTDIDVHADVGVGSGSFTVWTCDLSHEYIRINASYRS